VVAAAPRHALVFKKLASALHRALFFSFILFRSLSFSFILSRSLPFSFASLDPPMSQSILNELEKSRVTFIDGYTTPTRSDKQAIGKHIQLLEQDLASSNLNATSRFTRTRAQARLVDIYYGVDHEVFTLCMFRIPITRLGTAKDDGLIIKISQWWNSSVHPQGLTEMTKVLCDRYRIDMLMERFREPEVFTTDEVEGIALFPLCCHSTT